MDNFNLIGSALYASLPLFVGATILGWFVRKVRSIDENVREINSKLTAIDKSLLDIAAYIKAKDRGRDYF